MADDPRNVYFGPNQVTITLYLKMVFADNDCGIALVTHPEE
jgi:hypothetical protein